MKYVITVTRLDDAPRKVVPEPEVIGADTEGKPIYGRVYEHVPGAARENEPETIYKQTTHKLDLRKLIALVNGFEEDFVNE